MRGRRKQTLAVTSHSTSSFLLHEDAVYMMTEEGAKGRRGDEQVTGVWADERETGAAHPELGWAELYMDRRLHKLGSM
jgi:hypothetical protein